MYPLRIWALFLLFSFAASAEESRRAWEDVVYLKNGSVIRGIIVEEVPGSSLTIMTSDGNRLPFNMDQVAKITKEPPTVSTAPNAAIPLDLGHLSPGKNKPETWYTYWALGYASISYPADVDAVFDELADYPGVTHTPINMDLLGFYFPSNDGRTLYGGIINAFGDRYEADGEWFQLNSYLVSASAMHFLQGRIGQGPFFRSDIGLAKHSMDSSVTSTESSDWGLGVLLGGGFAFPVASGTRLTLSATYAMRRIAGETTKNLGLSLGGLF